MLCVSFVSDVSTWREGGGRGILSSPPSSPVNVTQQSAGPVVASSVEVLSSPTQTGSKAGMSRDVQNSIRQDDSPTIQDGQTVTPPTADGHVPLVYRTPAGAVRPDSQAPPNVLLAYQVPGMSMMMPPFVSFS